MSRQVVAVSLQTVREDVARTAEAYALSRDVVRSEAKRFRRAAGGGGPRPQEGRGTTFSTVTGSPWA